MKQIEVIVSGIVHVGTSGTNISEAMNLTIDARRNKAKVLNGALTIEHQLSSLISFYFFGRLHPRKEAFEALILNSDSCSFAVKRRLVLHFIGESDFLKGNEKNQLDKLLRRVMSIRNAFAHGRLSSNGVQTWLSYFEGTPREQELTDEYLTEVETTLSQAYQMTFELEQKLGVASPAGQSPQQ